MSAPFIAKKRDLDRQKKEAETLLSELKPRDQSLVVALNRQVSRSEKLASHQMEGLRGFICQSEQERVRLGGLANRIPGLTRPETRIYPSDNWRDEVSSQIHSVLPHPQEDAILAKQLDNSPAKKELPESNRLVGIELECTGVSVEQLENITHGISKREWNVVHDGSIPSIAATCAHRREGRTCLNCNKVQAECKCCRALIRCYNRDCGSNYCYSNWARYGHKCPNCREAMPLIFNVCACNGQGNCSDEHWQGCSTQQRCSCPTQYRGAEIVSPPGKTEAFFAKAKEIFDQVVFQAKENGSCHKHKSGDNATGYHVHVDARDLSQDQCALVVVFFNHMLADFRRQYPSILPKWRTENFYYCQRNSCLEPRNSLETVFSNNSRNRYRQVNLASLRKHGTIEFRVGYLPDTGDEVVSWAKACRALVDKVASLDKEDMAAIKNAGEGIEVLTLECMSEWIEGLDKQTTFKKAFFKQFTRGMAHV